MAALPESGDAPGDAVLKLSLEPRNSPTIYALPAYAGLMFFGRVFRGHGDGFAKAEKVEGYDQFWSYSRHASHFMGVCTLLVYYHAPQAAMASCAVATVIALLLPADAVAFQHAGLPCVVSGLCTALVVIITWRSRQRVFLDRASIPQDNEEMKRNGILNLAYYLKMSKTVVVLLDITYFRRLWCVFEFAAYLKLQVAEERAPGIKVLPAMYGGVTAMTFIAVVAFMLISTWIPADGGASGLSPDQLILGVALTTLSCLCASGWMAGVFSSHVRAFAEQGQQLRAFSLDEAECFCCSVGHTHPETKLAIECDRDLIRATVIDWFGDVDTFDGFVRQELQSHIVAKAHMPYVYVIASFAPDLWSLTGWFVWLLKTGQNSVAWGLLLRKTSVIFIYNPLFMRMVFRSFERWSKPGIGHRSAIFLSLSTAVVGHFLIWLTWRAVVNTLGLYGYIVLFVAYGTCVVIEYRNHWLT